MIDEEWNTVSLCSRAEDEEDRWSVVILCLTCLAVLLNMSIWFTFSVLLLGRKHPHRCNENNSDVAQYCDADYSTCRLCSYVMLLPYNIIIFCNKSVLVFCMHGAPEWATTFGKKHGIYNQNSTLWNNISQNVMCSIWMCFHFKCYK